MAIFVNFLFFSVDTANVNSTPDELFHLLKKAKTSLTCQQDHIERIETEYSDLKSKFDELVAEKENNFKSARLDRIPIDETANLLADQLKDANLSYSYGEFWTMDQSATTIAEKNSKDSNHAKSSPEGPGEITLKNNEYQEKIDLYQANEDLEEDLKLALSENATLMAENTALNEKNAELEINVASLEQKLSNKVAENEELRITIWKIHFLFFGAFCFDLTIDMNIRTVKPLSHTRKSFL